MGFEDVFNVTIAKIESILVDNPIPTPKPASNIQHTASNINQIFKFNGIWNDQIDNEVQSLKEGERMKFGGDQGFIIKCPAIFIEFIPGDGNAILGGVTQYPDAAMYFHLFSDELSSGNALMDANFQIYYLRDVVTSNFNGFHTSFSSAMMSRYDKLDYKHGTITKYLKGFGFCFNDTKGSIYDPKSPRYQVPVAINSVSAHPETSWISGTNYEELVNVVYLNLAPFEVGYYLCTTNNNDLVFTPTNWAYCALWSGGAYTVGAYVVFGYFVYQCTIANNDTIFNPSNWNIICRI